ncbi:RNA exonuclease 1 like protein [Habropoda laboriosa]|uniref:RNA exonuclease 1 like protein n=1 Tax=Habropoda laboriosa TaxID=597456 RepID=A0A0L7QL72_9HYME|nr:RNA exonuclease 1 like protein [Habropoda laboriosa]
MLPSTGYFKAINCPFYESGTCDRPYCHFKHSKREDAGITAEAAESVENRSTGQVQESKASTMNVVSQVVEGLKPTLTTGSPGTLDNITTNAAERRIDASTSVNKPLPCVYNPTPIAELKKRHIPIVSYMPTRESRVAVKPKCTPDGIKPWLSIGSESTEAQAAEIKYKPTTIINSETRDTMHSYVPTCKTDPPLPNPPCKDSGANEYLLKLREAYYPKCKKRREEYVPKKVKTPLKTVDGLNESVLETHFETDFNTIDEEVVMRTRSTSDVLESRKVSKDSCTHLEPKFSDDEDEEDGNSRDNIEDYGHDANKINTTHIDHRTFSTQSESDRRDLKKLNCSKDARMDTDVEFSETASLTNDGFVKEGENREEEEVEKVVEIIRDGYKSRNENAKEVKNREKSRNKDRKDRHGTATSRKRYKDRHNSNEKSRSVSRSRSKSKSHLRHSGKESRDKKHNRDRSKCKEKEKHGEKGKDKGKNENRHKRKTDRKDCDELGKRHEYDSKHSSKKEEHVKKNRSDGSNKRSGSSLESVRLNLRDDDDDDDDEEEENDDRYSNIIENDIDVVFSTSDSDHDVQEECLKIFQEYQVPERTKTTESSSETSSLRMKEKEKEMEREKEQNEETGRKRVAHPSAAASSVTRHIGGVSQQARKLTNPQQKMYERWRLMRDAVAEKTISASSGVSRDVRRNCVEGMGTASNSELKLNGNGRVRIAHVPYAMSLAIEKKKVTENAAGKLADTKATDNCKTAAQTAKCGVRVAHVPQMVPQLIRPEPLQVTTQKFPLNVRQYYVNLKEEYACHERCKALTVYKNSCMLAAHRLRKEVDQNSSSMENNAMTVAGSSNNTVSHEAVLTGKSKGSWSVLKTKRSVTEFRGPALYGMLTKWIMTEQQLRDNGFPRPHPDNQKGRAKVYVINSRNQSVLSKVPNERVCSRCGQTYMIDKQGFALQPQNCIYHWGRKFTIRGEGKYSCCQQYGSATGCCDAKTHVWDYTDYENLRGYVKTLPKDAAIEEQGVYALDCEMSYTTQGLELTRITVIDEDCNVMYETLVKPQNPIIDYNTRFSGITEEGMKDVTTTLLDVQATLLTMFSDKTILVGHSLESDFKALKLLHDTVVDTSIMFPHKNGYPQKRALKNLCSEYLRKIIQNDVGGHDSKEDAVACMELILWKAKEEAKLQ